MNMLLDILKHIYLCGYFVISDDNLEKIAQKIMLFGQQLPAKILARAMNPILKNFKNVLKD